MTKPTERPAVDTGSAEKLADRVFQHAVAVLEMANIHLGHSLGLYRALAEAEPVTSAELATRTGCDERYVREWLQAQAVSGFVTPAGPDETRVEFCLAPGAREALVDELSPQYVAPRSAQLAAVGRVLDQLAEAFTTGAGVPYTAYGTDAVAAQAASSRTGFHHELVSTWLGSAPDVLARLEEPARVADLGCGGGWSSIAIAQAFPMATVRGFDLDRESIELATRHADEAGVSTRVDFNVHDVAQPLPDSDPFDLVLLLKCLHDMPRPDLVLATARRALAPDGAVLVLDTAADPVLVAPTAGPRPALLRQRQPRVVPPTSTRVVGRTPVRDGHAAPPTRHRRRRRRVRRHGDPPDRPPQVPALPAPPAGAALRWVRGPDLPGTPVPNP